MVKITDGYYLSIDCYDNDSEEYADSIRLNIQDTEQLPDSIKYDIVSRGNEINLSDKQVISLRRYMDDEAVLDFDHYSYTLCMSQESWLGQQISEKQEKLIPDPKSVFALEVLEKGEEYGDGRIIPIFEIDTDVVRSHFKLAEPMNFDFDDRLDKDMLDFIKRYVKCNNINIEKYDYRPAIWENVFHNTDMTIVPCDIGGD